MKSKMYQAPVTEMYAVCAQAVVCGSTPDGVAGEDIDAGGNAPEGTMFD